MDKQAKSDDIPFVGIANLLKSNGAYPQATPEDVLFRRACEIVGSLEGFPSSFFEEQDMGLPAEKLGNGEGTSIGIKQILLTMVSASESEEELKDRRLSLARELAQIWRSSNAAK